MAKSNKKNLYSISIKTADGQSVDSKSESVETALSEFKPELIKGKVIVDVEKGDKKISKVLFVYVARKLFFNNVALKIFARNVERALS